jgi:hypothetical protein
LLKEENMFTHQDFSVLDVDAGSEIHPSSDGPLFPRSQPKEAKETTAEQFAFWQIRVWDRQFPRS